MIFLASPYTHPDPSIMKNRAIEISLVTARLITKGYVIFCPIAYCHSIAKVQKLRTDAEFWQVFNRNFLVASRELWICTMYGWQESVGVRDEVMFMHHCDKPIKTIEPDTLELRPLVL